MHGFLTGPLFYISLGVCVVGMIVRFYLYFSGLNWQLDRVAYKEYPAMGLKGALRSIYKWLIPYGTYGWRQQPVMTAAFFAFHIGAVCIPLFLVGHNVFLKEKLGFSLPTISAAAADIISWTAVWCWPCAGWCCPRSASSPTARTGASFCSLLPPLPQACWPGIRWGIIHSG